MTPFPVIFADPPWCFDDRLEMSETPRGAEANYPTLTIDAIAGLPVRSLAADDAVLVLWRPSSLAAEGLRVMSAWGFEQKQELIWYKVNDSGKAGFGMGRMLRAAKEVAFVGVRGSPYRHLRDKSIRDVFVAPNLKHSAKPEIVQDAFERMFPGPYLELFARRPRDGWTTVGNQAPDTLGRDVRDVVPEMARTIRDARLLRSA